MGFEDRLKEMEQDVDLDVKDRVKTALQHFKSGVPSSSSTNDVQMTNAQSAEDN